MGNVAVFASGSGTNFQAIADRLKDSSHNLALLVCDRKKAFAINRAEALGIPVKYVSYVKNTREEIERELIAALEQANISLIALAGYMRLFTPLFVEHFNGKMINIHPALLPKYPGTRGIEDSYESGDEELGISIHYVDQGMDTGPLILQKKIRRQPNETLESVAQRIHSLEHQWYPDVILELLDRDAADAANRHKI